jgi:hypothetical protein
MSLDLAQYQTKARDAVMAFWGNREKARQKQLEAGTLDAGERSSVTAGKNMNGFVALVGDLVEANGLAKDCIHRKQAVTSLPGYFRPTKCWDLVVINEGRLVAAVELKSQAGPSFGNNFNNRAEEAIGNAVDLWTAFREGAFGKHPKPFLGWLMLIEDAPASRSPVRERSPHFSVFDRLQSASYVSRYDILCERLVQERLYTAACSLASPRSAERTGDFSESSELTSLKTFVTAFAGHIATEAARYA